LRTIEKAIGYGASKQASTQGRAHDDQVRAQEWLDRQLPLQLVATNGQVIATSELREQGQCDQLESANRSVPSVEIENQIEQ
jgi:hypothetical protein